jgi:GDP-4-dehydro-6-deoxy-D-mannose reductase
MKETILLLGGNGFLGKTFISYYCSRNLTNIFDLVVIDQNFSSKIYDKVSYNCFDVLNLQFLEEFLIKLRPNYIVNCVGLLHGNDSNQFIQFNALFPKSLLDIIISNNLSVNKIVLVGSAAEYGANSTLPLTENDTLIPINYYGLSKVLQAQIFNFYHVNHGLKLNLARVFNVIGHDMSYSFSIGSFISQIKNADKDGIIKVGNLETERDYLYIEDVIRALLDIMIKGKDGEIYNVCSGIPTSMEIILKSLIDVSGKKLIIESDPALFKLGDIPISYGSSEKLKDQTGWAPLFNLNDAFKKLIYEI